MLNKDETLLFLACQDGFVRILDTAYFNLVAEFFGHEDGVTCFSLFPEAERYMLTGGKDAHLILWDLETKTCLKSIPAHNYVIYDILYFDAKHFLTISRDKTIKVWDSKAMQVIQKIDSKKGGHKHSINSVLRVDQHNFATCSDDKSIKLFTRTGLF